jgi:spermidine synthase
MKKLPYVLELIVFLCGAVVMIFEILGSRILGPYFGTSIFVWTSLIGVVLGSLSLGYFIGGKISDKNPSVKVLSLVILLSAVFILFSLFIKKELFIHLYAISDVRISSIIAALILFSPASILLGIVSPYAAKLKLNNLSTSGATIGNLYAISTAGSIFGTFLSGFYLIPHFGTNKLLILLSAVLTASALLLSLDKYILKFLFLVGLAPIWLVVSGHTYIPYLFENYGMIDIDTEYNRIWIYNYVDKNTNRIARIMGINGENHSSMFLDSDELVNETTKYFHLAAHFNPAFKKTLMIGAAAYSFPMSFLKTYPDATIDVVEIDPALTEIAKKYFNMKENGRLSIYHQDGRVYLNKTKEKYDVIFGDAFANRHSVPYQLTTQEAVQKKFDILNENGVVILDTISAVNGEKGTFLRAEYATYRSVFPQVFLFPIKEENNGDKIQNIILVALKSNKKYSFTSNNSELNKYLSHRWIKPIAEDVPILTDDFAPVDYYTSRALAQNRP